LVLGVLLLEAVPAAASANWHIESAANAPESLEDRLAAVSCTTTESCIAVGKYTVEKRGEETAHSRSLVDVWNGSSWKNVVGPLPMGAVGAELNANSCVSSTSCEAAGEYSITAAAELPLAAAWNGKEWTVQTVALTEGGKTGTLKAISGTSASSCMAGGSVTVGTEERPLAEQWNGKQWAAKSTPKESPAAFLGISCQGGKTVTCEAVGEIAGLKGLSGNTLAESWNGTEWTVNKAVPLEHGSLLAIECASASACNAVGWYDEKETYDPLGERWNGKEWVNESDSEPKGKLAAVICETSTACLAVGFTEAKVHLAQPFAQMWHGEGWAGRSILSPGEEDETELLGVSCSGSERCTAVGYYEPAKVAQVFVERETGS